ncbi:hypothetical protein SELMODRAFT_419098 [Selaginella moellendorffii]|uniref:Uncharacterized protein n=1 Tax=Selaginella moellendorffii TaxID=88036 RepID=D8S7U4_SELML|nr:hypothetical protein SELMODRAFT_419098 [Selaginella moellendorffii]
MADSQYKHILVFSHPLLGHVIPMLLINQDCLESVTKIHEELASLPSKPDRALESNRVPISFVLADFTLKRSQAVADKLKVPRIALAIIGSQELASSLRVFTILSQIEDDDLDKAIDLRGPRLSKVEGLRLSSTHLTVSTGSSPAGHGGGKDGQDSSL